MKISIVIPAHNEEENIAQVIGQIENTLSIPHELVVVNDHSTDATAAKIEELAKKYPNLRPAENTMEKGFANALRAGFASASGLAIVPVMADLCDDLPTIEKMYRKIEEGFDLVCGSRYIKGGLRQGGSKLKGLFSCFVGRSLGFLLGLPTHDIANAFKMYRKEVLENIDIRARSFEISMEIPLKAYFAGYRMTEVATVWKERTKGKSSFKMFRLLPNYLKLYLWAIIKRMVGGCRFYR